MTRRTVTTKNGDEWQWEETPEVAAALRKLHGVKFEGNYPGPLYAPHPHITNDQNKN